MERRNKRGARTVSLKKAKTSVYICKEHMRNQNLMCMNHKYLVCDKCAAFYHVHCEVLDTRSAVQSVKPTVLELKRAVTLMERRYESSVGKFQREVEKAIADVNEAEQRVMMLFSSLRSRLRMTGAEQTDAIEKHKDNIRDMWKEINAIENADKESDIALVLQRLKGIEKLDKKISTQSKDHYIPTVTLRFSDELSRLLRDENNSRTLGYVKVLRYPVINNNKEISLKLIKSLRLFKLAELESNVPQYTALDFLTNERIVVLDSSNRLCKVLSLRLKLLGSYLCQYNPLDVSTVSDREVAVTSGSECVIDILNIDEENVISLQKRIKTTFCCDSICLISGERLAVSTFADLQPVKVVTCDGDEKSDVIRLPRKLLQMGGSTVAFSPLVNKFVLTDRFQNAIQLYNMQDKTVHVITDKNLENPRGVCVSPSGYIYVCSQNNHSLVEISPSGKVTGCYKLSIRYPRTVSINKDGTKLVVSNGIMNAGKVQIYSFE